MDQLMHVLLIVLLLNMVHHKVSYLQAITLQTLPFAIFVTQCNNFLMFILNAMAFVINILIKIPLLTSFLEVVTIVFDGIGSNVIKINNFYPIIKVIKVIQLIIHLIKTLYVTAIIIEELYLCITIYNQTPQIANKNKTIFIHLLRFEFYNKVNTNTNNTHASFNCN